MDLNDLSIFAAVVETKSFSAAARRLGIPKSSVSRAISRFEGAMGLRMIHRTTRQVTVSTAGNALFEKVHNEIASLRHAVGEHPELTEEPSGLLRITAPSDWSEYLADLMMGFLSRYRTVEIDLRLTNEHIDLVGEGIDLALRFATKRLRDSSLTARKLGPASVQLFASPSYLARRGTPRTPKDLDQHEWVVHRATRQFALQAGRRSAVITTRGRLHCDHHEFLQAALVNGLGIGALGPSEAAAEVAAGRLIRVLPSWSCPISNLWAVWPGGRQLPRKASAFVDFVSDMLKTKPLT